MRSLFIINGFTGVTPQAFAQGLSLQPQLDTRHRIVPPFLLVEPNKMSESAAQLRLTVDGGEIVERFGRRGNAFFAAAVSSSESGAVTSCAAKDSKTLLIEFLRGVLSELTAVAVSRAVMELKSTEEETEFLDGIIGGLSVFLRNVDAKEAATIEGRIERTLAQLGDAFVLRAIQATGVILPARPVVDVGESETNVERLQFPYHPFSGVQIDEVYKFFPEHVKSTSFSWRDHAAILAFVDVLKKKGIAWPYDIHRWITTLYLRTVSQADIQDSSKLSRVRKALTGQISGIAKGESRSIHSDIRDTWDIRLFFANTALTVGVPLEGHDPNWPKNMQESYGRAVLGLYDQGIRLNDGDIREAALFFIKAYPLFPKEITRKDSNVLWTFLRPIEILRKRLSLGETLDLDAEISAVKELFTAQGITDEAVRNVPSSISLVAREREAVLRFVQREITGFGPVSSRLGFVLQELGKWIEGFGFADPEVEKYLDLLFVVASAYRETIGIHEAVNLFLRVPLQEKTTPSMRAEALELMEGEGNFFYRLADAASAHTRETDAYVELLGEGGLAQILERFTEGKELSVLERRLALYFLGQTGVTVNQTQLTRIFAAAGVDREDSDLLSFKFLPPEVLLYEAEEVTEHFTPLGMIFARHVYTSGFVSNKILFERVVRNLLDLYAAYRKLLRETGTATFNKAHAVFVADSPGRDLGGVIVEQYRTLFFKLLEIFDRESETVDRVERTLLLGKVNIKREDPSIHARTSGGPSGNGRTRTPSNPDHPVATDLPVAPEIPEDTADDEWRSPTLPAQAGAETDESPFDRNLKPLGDFMTPEDLRRFLDASAVPEPVSPEPSVTEPPATPSPVMKPPEPPKPPAPKPPVSVQPPPVSAPSVMKTPDLEELLGENGYDLENLRRKIQDFLGIETAVDLSTRETLSNLIGKIEERLRREMDHLRQLTEALPQGAAFFQGEKIPSWAEGVDRFASVGETFFAGEFDEDQFFDLVDSVTAVHEMLRLELLPSMISGFRKIYSLLNSAHERGDLAGYLLQNFSQQVLTGMIDMEQSFGGGVTTAEAISKWNKAVAFALNSMWQIAVLPNAGKIL